MTAAEIRSILDTEVQRKRFEGDQVILFHQFFHLIAVLAISIVAALNIAVLSWYTLIGLAMLAGHSVCMCAFAAHEITHGAGRFRARWVRRLVEHLGWAFGLFTSATLQRRAHNGMHHHETNIPADPDRRLSVAEYASRSPLLSKISPFIFPNGKHPLLTGLYGWGLAVTCYHNAIFWNTMLQTGRTHDMRLASPGRRRVALELLANCAVYAALWTLSGYAPKMVVYLGLMYFTGAWVAGIYIATNHLLCGHHDHYNDPLANTISLRVPRWIDVLHMHFSHHVEHHLYPSLPSSSYPTIRASLRKHFPDQYREMTFPTAVREILSRPFVMLDHNTQTYPGGAPPTVPVLFPNNPTSRAHTS